jgi:hypothetical protein
MQNLKDFDSSGIALDIVEDHNRNIILRIFNNSNANIHTALEGSRYISIINGILSLDDTNPIDMEYSSIGQTILPKSFMNVQMSFKITKIMDSDRIELHLNNVADLILKRNNGTWFVVENNDKKHLSESLDSKIEHLDALEEKFGISLQNLTVNILDQNSIKPYCEVLSTSNKGPVFSFSIEVGIYNKTNKIIGFTSLSKSKEDFLGFEIFSFSKINLEVPIEEIGKIIFYPVKR